MPALPPRSLADVSHHYAAERGEKTAFVTRDEAIDFATFDRRSAQVANGFGESGLVPGDRVAYLCRNHHFVYELLFGAAHSGAVATGLNWRLSPHELAFILEDCQARLLFVDAEFVELATKALALANSTARPMTTGASYETWRERQSTVFPPREIDPSDIVCQLHTSGTTGNPKGAMLSHRSFLRQLHCEDEVGPLFQMDETDVALVVSPLFHIGGLAMGTSSFLRGRGTVLCEPSPATILEAIEDHRATTTFLVPAMIQSLLDDPTFSPARTASLKLLRYGASAISSALMRRATAELGCGLVQVYGMTECCGGIGCLPPSDHLDAAVAHRLASCGKPFPHVEMMIADSGGTPLEAGQVGEVLIRSPSIMEGYWNRPEANQEALTDGWYKSGDAGYLDRDGYLYLCDRIKDMIISGGENIYPAEVENAICEHEAVLEAAVIGIPDAKWGEAVKAFVVLKPGHAVSGQEIIASAKTRIAGFKAPKTVVFVEALPRNSGGKVLRRELRAPFWESHGRQIG